MQNRRGGREGGGVFCSLTLSLFFFFFCTTHTIISPSFHFGGTNIAARGGEGWRGVERAEKAEVVGRALAWPVIREADPALSSHSGQQSKQEFTIAGLSAPFSLTTSPPAFSRVGECVGGYCRPPRRCNTWHSRGSRLGEAAPFAKGQKWC